MKINLLKNITYSDAQLTKIAQAEIRLKISKDHEDNLARKIRGFSLGARDLSQEELIEINQYKNDLEFIQAESNQAQLDNLHLINVMAYEKALKRLAQYQLAIGKGEVPILDDETGEQIGVTSIIEPVDELIDGYDENGELIEISNPLIIKDEEERLSAQPIVDNATQNLLELHHQRNNITTTN